MSATEEVHAPRVAADADGARSPRALFWVLLVLVTLAAFELRRRQPVPGGRELLPSVDAREYAETARRLAFEQKPGLRIGLQDYPSRYPLGFPLFLAPVARITGGDAKSYPLFMNALGALSVALAGLLGARLVSRWVGLLAAVLFALAPLHRHYSGVVMSDLASLVVYQGVVAVMLLRGPAGVLRSIVAGGLMGLGAVMRMANPLIFLPLPFFWMLTTRRLAPIVAMIAAAVPFLGLELLQRARTLGDPFGDGYAYWVGLHTEAEMEIFDFARVLAYDEHVYPRKGPEISNGAYYGELLTGDSPVSFAPGVGVLLILVGLAVLFIGRSRADRRALIGCLLLPTLLTIGVHLAYFWRDARFLFPTYPLVALALAAAVGWIVRALIERGVPRAAVLGALPLALVAGLHEGWRAEPISLAGRLELPEAAEALGDVRPGLVVTNASILAVRNVLLADGPGAIPILPLTAQTPADRHVTRLMTQRNLELDGRDFGVLYAARPREPVMEVLPRLKGPGPLLFVLVQARDLSKWPELAARMKPYERRVVFDGRWLTVLAVDVPAPPAPPGAAGPSEADSGADSGAAAGER